MKDLKAKIKELEQRILQMEAAFSELVEQFSEGEESEYGEEIPEEEAVIFPQNIFKSIRGGK